MRFRSLLRSPAPARWRRIEPNGDRPSGRASHSAVSDELAGVMYIFGGSGSHFGYTNQRDLYEFNYESAARETLAAGRMYRDLASAGSSDAMANSGATKR